MPVLFRFVGRLLVAVAVLSASSACTKSDSAPTPAAPAGPTTGSLGGSYVPDFALRTVTATLPGAAPVTVTPSPSGSYWLRDLPAGTYTLSYDPAPGYRVPAARTVVLAPGGSTTVPLLTLAPEGSFTFGYLGSTFTADYISASLAGGVLRLSAGSGPSAGVSLRGLGVTGTGTFNLEQGLFVHGNNRYQQNSYYAPGLRITSLNLTTRLVSGTFFFEADPYAGSGYTTGISGTFTDVVLQ